MDKRIKELVEQAMVTIPAAEGPLGHTYFDKEKFAKLVMADCAYLARQCYTVSAAQADTVAQHIEENFGRYLRGTQ